MMAATKKRAFGQCGTMGCRLDNLHAGLCQIAMPSATRRRRAPAGKGERISSSYRAADPEPAIQPLEPPKQSKTVPLGQRHQVAHLPECSTAACSDELDRGDTLIPFSTEEEVIAALQAEREAAARWEARRAARRAAAIQAHANPDAVDMTLRPPPLSSDPATTPLKDATSSTNTLSTPTRARSDTLLPKDLG